jgi:hypothetical protein
MTTRWWRVLGLLLLVPVVLVAGCAPEGAYRGATSSESYISNVPPSFYGNDPTLSQWYTAPYFMPYESP